MEHYRLLGRIPLPVEPELFLPAPWTHFSDLIEKIVPSRQLKLADLRATAPVKAPFSVKKFGFQKGVCKARN
jgi:hypothetical protein